MHTHTHARTHAHARTHWRTHARTPSSPPPPRTHNNKKEEEEESNNKQINPMQVCRSPCRKEFALTTRIKGSKLFFGLDLAQFTPFDQLPTQVRVIRLCVCVCGGGCMCVWTRAWKHVNICVCQVTHPS